MADSLCGPSNALKTFSGQLDRDRTSHQSQNRPSNPSQLSQFRTSDLSERHAQDAHLHSLVNGLHRPGLAELGHGTETASAMPLPPHMTVGHHGFPGTQHVGPANVPDWVFKFNQMDLDMLPHPPQQSQHPQQPFHIHQPAAAIATPSFSQGQFPSSSLVLGAAYHESPFAMRPGMWSNSQETSETYAGPSAADDLYYAQQSWLGNLPSQQVPPPPQMPLENDREFVAHMDAWMATHGPHAHAAIDAELERLAEELEQASRSLEQPESILPQQEHKSEPTTALSPDLLSEQVVSTSSDPLADTRRQDEQKGPETTATAATANTQDNAKKMADSNLAEAARRMVSAMTSSKANAKIQNSTFLSLMRQLADGSVVQEGNDFVDVNGKKISTVSPSEENHSNTTTDVNRTRSGSSDQHHSESEFNWKPIDLTNPAAGIQ